MTVISTDLIARDTAGPSSLLDWAKGLRARHSNWRHYRRTMRELGDLTDAELADIGMSRRGIRIAARHAVYG